MKILSLFSGIGAFEKALKNIGIEYELIGFSEIDKYAIKSYCAIHHESEEKNLGDITKIDISKLPKDIDLITHGSPCQDFSIAGKQAGGDLGTGTRSSLMWNTINIVIYCKPKYVIWENVKNLLSKKHRHNFDSYLSIMESLGYNNYYQVLNAKDYGIPQNRERVYTISIRKDIDKGNFIFPEKEELKLRLKDMLEDEVDEKYYLSDEKIEKIKSSNFMQEKKRIQEKEYIDTILARDWKDPKCVRVGGIFDTKQEKHQAGSIYDKDQLAPTLNAMQGGWRQPSIIVHNLKQKVKVRKYPVDKEKLKQVLRKAKLEKDVTNECIANIVLNVPITTVEHWFRKDDSFAIPTPDVWFKLKDFLGIKTDEFDESIMTFEEKDGIYEKSDRIYDEEGISPTLTQQKENIIERTPLKFLNRNQKNIEGDYAYCIDSCNTGGIKEISKNNFRIRKLTPKECWRLMGFDDEDFEKAANVPTSNTQLYKQAGNSIVVNVLEKIFNNLLVEKKE